jgi:hypothetical protein
MSDTTSPVYDPLNVFKPLGADIGIVDGPLEYMTIAGVRLPLGFPTRMTVVRLSDGTLLLHSPIAFNPALAEHLKSMGTVRYLISPNQFHYAHIGEWSRAFPDAIAWASQRVRRRARARGIAVEFARDLSDNAPKEWRADIDQTAIPGGYFGEIVFFHKASKTLILTDTIINLELERLREPWRSVTRLSGMYYPNGQIFFGMRLPLFLHRRKTRAAVQKFLNWHPEKIVLSHGRCFETGARGVIERLFGGVL